MKKEIVLLSSIFETPIVSLLPKKVNYINLKLSYWIIG